jgi:putative transposase
MMANVLDRLPKRWQEKGKAAVQKIWHAESLTEAEKWRKEFRSTFGGQYPKAVENLEKDWAALTAYYAFPKERSLHLRTTNVIESPFSAVRLRTSAAKRFKRVDNATAMIWRPTLVAEKTFRKLNAPELCRAVYRGAEYHNGVRVLKRGQKQPAVKTQQKNRKSAAA